MFNPQQLMQLMSMVQQPNSNPMNIIQQMVGKYNPLMNRAMQMGEGKNLLLSLAIWLALKA